MKEILNTPISDTKLRVMTKNSLIHNGGLKTIKDIINAGSFKIGNYRGIGLSSKIEIVRMLNDLGLSWDTDTTPELQHTITFKAGHSITVESWIADEARRWISDQRLQFKNFTKDGVIVISINLSDVSFIQ